MGQARPLHASQLHEQLERHLGHLRIPGKMQDQPLIYVLQSTQIGRLISYVAFSNEFDVPKRDPGLVSRA